jgi:phosphopantothenoylcysteine decarboxylase/phosphopantothenate--cysteine ligase
MNVEAVLCPDLEGRRVLLAVAGGIAAYKSAELCRLLARCGAQVNVMMTAAARRFVGEITFAALTNNPVAVDLFGGAPAATARAARGDLSASPLEPAPAHFGEAQEAQIGHIQLADEADLLLVAPATANILAKLCHGVADDLVSTVYLACTAPVLLAPAMNVNMWKHPATQANLKALRARGHAVVGPGSGELACGHEGAGRMAEPDEILQAAGACLSPRDLKGRSVLITAGPTHEPLDPVRFIGNRSSGRMGFALAAEAAARGARTVLVVGPTALPTPYGAERIDVVSAKQMAQAVHERCEAGVDALLMSAAVADYRPTREAESKIKKNAVGDRWTLSLEQNPDILATVCKGEHRPPVVVGFAAETGEAALTRVKAKRERKGCDLLVANDVMARDAGFEVDTNKVTIFGNGGEEELPLMSKRQVARKVIDRVVKLLPNK